jgi:hypothetical protein
MRSMSALGNVAEAPQAPQRPDQQSLVLTDAERQVVVRALASAHHALEKMPPRLRPAEEVAAVDRLLQRLLGDNWAALVSTVRYRVR